MEVYFDSRNEFYKKPFGAVKCGTEVLFRLKVSNPIKSLKCYLAMWQDNEKLEDVPMERREGETDNDFIYEIKYKMPKTFGIVWYHFILENFEQKYYYSNNEAQTGGVGKITEYSPISYQQTVYKLDKTPSWFKEGIAYQIFPDRFYKGSDFPIRKEALLKRYEGKDSGKYFIDDWYKVPTYGRDDKGKVNDYEFYGGTLKGIEEKLPYLKELNVDVIYLNPIFEARSNHRYDTGDYKKIDTLLGDEKDFDSLIKKADELGIKIVLDGVFSHQGADSIYFNKRNNYDEVGAYNSKDSKYYDWYKFKSYPNEYECWWGVDALPEVNELNDTYLNFICKSPDSVVKHWMKKGIAGFRLDVADELPDEFIVETRKAIESVDKNAILIGEVWEDATNKVSYGENRKYFLNASLKSVMNYPFMEAAVDFMKGNITPYELNEFFYKQMENYPIEYFYANLNLLGSHDRVRIITKLADCPPEENLNEYEKETYMIPSDKYFLAVSRLKVLSTLQYMIPGVPMIYYGDEVGLYGYSDPYNRKTYPWGKEDKLLFDHYKMLSNIRKGSKAIKKGTFRTVFCGKHTFGFERKEKDETVLVFINRGIFHEESEHIEVKVDSDKAVDLYTGENIDIIDGKLSFDISSLGYRIIRI